MKNREIEAGAKVIANDLVLPGGRQKKLARVIGDHLPWFEAAEARGMTWEDMVAVLSAAGVTGQGGRKLTVGTLSSTVWRKQRKAPSRTARGAEPPAATARPEPAALPARSRTARSRKQFDSHTRPASGAATPDRHPPTPAAPTNATLEFMQRAARMRRATED